MIRPESEDCIPGAIISNWDFPHQPSAHQRDKQIARLLKFLISKRASHVGLLMLKISVPLLLFFASIKVSGELDVVAVKHVTLSCLFIK